MKCFIKRICRPVKFGTHKKPRPIEPLQYQVEPYDYYVSDYFMLKSIQHVMPHIEDDELYEIACNEMVKHNKVSIEELKKHVTTISDQLVGDQLVGDKDLDR